MTELIEEGLLNQEEVGQIWKNLPKVANRVKAAGAAGTEDGMLINLEGFLEFDRQVCIFLLYPSQLICRIPCMAVNENMSSAWIEEETPKSPADI